MQKYINLHIFITLSLLVKKIVFQFFTLNKTLYLFDSNFTENLSSEFGSCYTLNSADHEDSRGGLKIARPGLYYGKYFKGCFSNGIN